MNPYPWVFQQPELLMWYAGLTLVFAGWTIWSVRKLFRWGVSIRDSLTRSDSFLPTMDTTAEILWFAWTLAAWFIITGAFLYVVV